MMNRDALRVVLLSPRNPLNIGAAARAMSNFGFPQLRIVNAYEVAYQEARSAVNATAILARSEQYHSLEDAVSDCTLVVGTTSLGHRELQVPLHRLEMASRLIQEASATGPVALLFGSEKFGLSNREMAYCHWLTRIPTRDEHGSMNLGQAVAVCLYELSRSEEAVSRQPEVLAPATADELHRFTELLLEATRESGYVNPKTAETTEAKIRRMVNRLSLTARDVPTWQGILRQLLWKVRSLSYSESSPMTKIQLTYELIKPLDDALLNRISSLNGVYGIERVQVSPGMDSIMVEYDASRLNGAEVENVLHRSGIPVQVRA